MFGLDLPDLEFDNIPNWPLGVKIATIVAACLVIFALAYFMDFKSKQRELDGARKHELTLKQSLEKEQRTAVNLSAYQKQFKEMKIIFRQLLRQLPNKTEVPGLLEDISKTGIKNGLAFRLFDPLGEVDHGFYVEFPIKISVVGNYQQFGEFVSGIANFHRIVTLHDVDIRPLPKVSGKPKGPEQLLMMDLTAKTYRYVSNENQ